MLYFWIFLTCFVSVYTKPLNVGSFNIRIFGSSKMADISVKDNLINIITRYDVILLQEIREKTGKSIQKLLKDINSRVQSKGFQYKLVLSKRLGRTNSKEQYAFLYRSDMVNLEGAYVYNDVADIFEREPYIVKFKTSDGFRFAIAGIHTQPRFAQEEVSNLTRVYRDIQATWKIDDVILMGDFNAACSYIDEWDRVDLARDKRFYWLIDNNKDTTSTSTSCAYDRIVVAGKNLLKRINPEEVHVFHYDREFNLDKNKTLLISDHYPVGFQIESLSTLINIDSSKSIRLHDRRKTPSIHEIYKLRKDSNSVISKYSSTGAYLEIISRKTSSDSAEMLKYIRSLPYTHAHYVSESEARKAGQFMRRASQHEDLPYGYGQLQTLRDYYLAKKMIYTVDLLCDLADRSNPKCYLDVKIEIL